MAPDAKELKRRAQFLGVEAVKAILFAVRTKNPEQFRVALRIAKADAIQAATAGRDYLNAGGERPRKTTHGERKLLRAKVEEIVNRGWSPLAIPSQPPSRIRSISGRPPRPEATSEAVPSEVPLQALRQVLAGARALQSTRRGRYGQK